MLKVGAIPTTGPMYFDRFDILEAWYLWLNHNHAGQFSEDYSRLSKMLEYFKPGPMLDYDSLTGNGKAIYDGIGV